MELVIVVLIIGILSAVAVPRFTDSLCRFRVEAAARRIAADVNLARQQARNSESEQWVLFYPSSDYYKLYNDPHPDHPAQEYVIKLTKTAYPVYLVSAVFENTNGYKDYWRLRFDSYGSPQCGAPPTVPYAPLVSGTVVVQSGNAQRTVVINPVTGKASVQ
jgi:type II secretory pathway pseudopilin PulG